MHVYQNDFNAAPLISKANDLTGIFTAPSGSIAEAEIFLLTNNKYNITFQPDEAGIRNTISWLIMVEMHVLHSVNINNIFWPICFLIRAFD